MDEIKRRVTELLRNGRFKLNNHFLKRSAERDASIQDARRVLKGGVVDSVRSRGNSLAFVGNDTKDRRTCVIVRIDEAHNRLVLKTIFQLTGEGDEEEY
jgi:hypothetical protein